MSEVGLTDLSRLLHSKRNESNAIVTSRKRKLRELFAVATHAEGLPQDGITKPDAPAPTQAESEFLQANDILQGRKFNEQSIPSRQQARLEVLRRSLVLLGYGAVISTPTPPFQEAGKEAHRHKQPPKPSSVPNSQPPGPAPPTITPAVSPTETKTTPVTHVPLPKHVATSQATTIDKTKQSLPSAVKSSKPEPIATQTTPNGPVPKPPTYVRPPAQVSFPPDVKTAPTRKSIPEKTGSASEERSNDGMVPKGRGSAPPTIKPPVDAARAPDALSSPGSTTHTATTPGAVHDASTDTSPDNEGPNYLETDRKNSPDEQDEAGDREDDETPKPPSVIEETPAESPESAEAQLLQESIRSSATARGPEAVLETKATSPVPASTTATEQLSLVEETNKASDQELSQHAADITKPEDPSQDALDPAKSVEIPDSREETPDRMDVDVSEVTSDEKVESVPTMKETRMTTQERPSTPTVENTPKETSQGPERAVTRVSSGALKPKSVNEIVGGSLRQPANSIPQPQITKEQHIETQLTPLTSTPQSPGSRPRRISSGRKDKAKGQVSAVLFGKQPKKLDEQAVVSGSKEAIHPSDDYYTPLFVQGFAGSSSWMQPMDKILFHANKTLATPDINLCIQDHQACKILRRVYHLQSNDKWSLRQLKRSPEPTRPPSHWDVMLQEIKWMRTDFREERKWKMAVARNMANACAQWFAASPQQRRAMQVAAAIPPKPAIVDDVNMTDGAEDGAESQATPDLIPGDTESPQAMDELVEVFHETVSPSAIFTLQEDDVVFGLRRTPAADQLLEELPIFSAPLKVPHPDPIAPEVDPDAHWRRPALPLSKYVEGHMKVSEDGPPRKRTRYTYHNEDSDDEGDGSFDRESTIQRAQLPPQSDAVALFNPEMKHIRDRLHAGHQFRPPTDQPMPPQSFYECRNPSMWTHAEDDELRGLVRDYSYNWPLISSMLVSKSLFSSGAERRTPWECFERWIQLEGLPSDMSKTQYFRAYNSRIEAAQRVIAQQNQLAAQQASAAGVAVPPLRRRQSTPLRVERRRQQKHLTLLDAMRKLAKKREAAAQKQQHTATQNAANKKQDAVAQAQRAGSSKTPRDYSILRWERDQSLAEKMALYAHRHDATRRAAIMQARAQGQGQRPQGPGAQAGQNVQPPIPGVAGANGQNGVPRPNGTSQAGVANQARARMPMAPPGQATNAMGVSGGPQMPNGLVPPVAGATPQAQMQALQAQQRIQMPNHPQPDPSMMLRAQRISEQQRVAVQLQQAHQQQHQHPHQQHQQNGGGAGTPRPPSQHSSPPNMVNGVVGVNGVNGVNGMNQQSYINNAQAMMAQFNSTNGGHTSPPANMHMAASSPRPLSQMQIPPGLANQINQFEASLRTKNPNLSPEQARQMATEHLARTMMAQRQSAMSAAAGATGQHGIANSIAATTSPHQYAALLRQQQQQQAAQQQAQQAQQAQHQQAQQQQMQHPQPQHPQLQQTASQAASSPGQVSHTSHLRQSSEGATPSAAP